MARIRRRTTCPVPGHGTRCEVSHEQDRWYPRSTEERLVMAYELGTEYDGEADALYVRVAHGPVASTRELDGRTNVDYDAAGRVLGVEVLSPTRGARSAPTPR